MCAEDDEEHQRGFWKWCALGCAHFRRRIAPVWIENRAILRPFWREFGAEHACIDRKTCAIIAGSRCASFGAVVQQNIECAVRCARKIEKNVDENRTSLR